MTHEEALNKVRKLLALSTSDNPNESALAAAKAQEIMLEFGIERASAEMQQNDSADTDEAFDEEIQNFGNRGAHIDAVPMRAQWRGYLGQSVAGLNACMIYWIGRRIDGSKVFFMEVIGRPSDVETTRYVYGWLSREIERLCNEQGKGCGHTWRNQFRLGAVETITSRLTRARRESVDKLRADASAASGTAIVKLNNALTHIEQRKLSVIRWQKEHLKMRTVSAASGRSNESGLEAGRRAGNSVALGGGRKMIGG